MVSMMKIYFPRNSKMVVATNSINQVNNSDIQIMLTLKKISRMESILNMVFHSTIMAFLNKL